MARTLAGKHPQYYEAVLQLRHTSQEVIDFAEEEIERVGLTVAKVDEERYGFDYYLSDNNLTKALGRRLQMKFGGELVITATLHGQKKDKELYRLTVLFRQAQFSAGDRVIRDGEIYKAITLAKEIILQHEKTGKKVRVRYNEMSRIKKIEDHFV